MYHQIRIKWTFEIFLLEDSIILMEFIQLMYVNVDKS